VIDGESIVIIGGPGSGKTTLAARAIAMEVTRKGRLCFALDPSGDVVDRLTGESAANDTLPKDRIAKVQSAAAAFEALHRKLFFGGKARTRVQVCVFALRKGVEPETLASEFLAACEDSRARGALLFVDEAQLLWPTAPRGAALRVLTMLRNRGQRLYATTQRPQLVATTLRANATHACVFRVRSGKAIDPGCAEFGNVERFERCLKLERFKYLHAPAWAPDPDVDLEEFNGLKDPIPWFPVSEGGLKR
jgi:hypothetical protein